jgi:hypothetical protein
MKAVTAVRILAFLILVVTIVGAAGCSKALQLGRGPDPKGSYSTFNGI